MKTNRHSYVFFILSIALVSIFPGSAVAQLERERVVTDSPVDLIFWATRNIGISTVTNPAANNLHSSVMHTFGLVDGGVDHFFGLDDGANTRLGMVYGIIDRFSVGVSRMTFLKVVNIEGKLNILRQTTSGKIPFDVAVKASTGITTLSGLGLEFSERISYFTSLMVARKFNGFSLQLSPMYAHFNNPSGNNFFNQLFGLGVLMSVEMNERFALSGEYLPVFGDRNPGTTDTMAIALNINTGGHVFQVFFSSSQWHNEQFIMANNRDRFWEGDFRFGFNIHRVFGLRGE